MQGWYIMQLQVYTVVATKNATLANIFFLHSATVFFVDFISQKNNNMNSILNSLLRNIFFLNININIFPIVQTKTSNEGQRKYILTCTLHAQQYSETCIVFNIGLRTLIKDGANVNLLWTYRFCDMS